MNAASRRVPVSVVAVFNDGRVLEECLARSVSAGRAQAPRTETIFMDNTQRRYPTAGAALNAGVAQASNEVVAFVHQDVVMHDLVALERAAGLLCDTDFGVLGVVGVDDAGRVQGRLRDRVLLIGQPCPDPVVVDSLDEVCFLATREQLRAEPLVDDPTFAWHAYAVEYGLRMRSLGRRVGAVDIPITHNSLTTNLAALDEAHAEVADRYRGFAPIRTTCGVVGERFSSLAPLDRGLRLARRLRDRAGTEWTAARLRRLRDVEGMTLTDLRFDLDHLLAAVDPGRLLVHNVTPADEPFNDGGTTTLRRYEHHLRVRSGPLAGAVDLVQETLAASETRDAVLVTNLTPDEATTLRAAAPGTPMRLGYAAATGLWLLAARSLPGPAAWAGWKRRPVTETLIGAGGAS